MSNPNCWVWDGYIGECVKLHKVPWWDYMNVFSISAVIAFITVCIILLVLAVNRWV